MTSDRLQLPEPEPDRLAAFVAGIVEGRAAARESLAEALAPELRRTVRSFLGGDDADTDDVVSESIIVVLDYVVRREGFTGDLLKFAITVALNRCRNLAAWRRVRRHTPLESAESWLADEAASPLDLLDAAERRAVLQRSLDAIDGACRRLLRAHYLEGRSIEHLRGELGLGSVQAVYYRRAMCLKKAFRVLNKRFGFCSYAGDPEPGNASREEGDRHG